MALIAAVARTASHYLIKLLQSAPPVFFTPSSGPVPWLSPQADGAVQFISVAVQLLGMAADSAYDDERQSCSGAAHHRESGAVVLVNTLLKRLTLSIWRCP